MEEKQGKYTGYRVEGTTYFLAPSYGEEWENLRSQQEGIEHTLETLQAHAEQVYTQLARARHKLWVRVSDDLGVPFITLGAHYDAGRNAIIVVPKEEKGEA